MEVFLFNLNFNPELHVCATSQFQMTEGVGSDVFPFDDSTAETLFEYVVVQIKVGGLPKLLH